MNLGISKTIALLLLILLGVLLKKKIKSKEALGGIKVLILSVALPATIFVALLKVNISPELLMLPVLALAINFTMFGGAKIFTTLSGEKNKVNRRTMLLLMPSFAPGLSCFPFLTEYLGEKSLAIAALADVGNKVFGLIILYLIAMSWHYAIKKKTSTAESGTNKYKSLVMALISEPINIVIVLAVMMLYLGYNYVSLPQFGQDAISKLSLMMTPLVLIFIGIAVKVGKKDVMKILQILFWRSGFAFLVSTVLLLLLPKEVSVITLLVAIALPQSSCSFWPFAHMVAVSKLDEGSDIKTFNLDLAVNILAFSLPFSTMIILLICSTGTYFANPTVLLLIGLTFISIGIAPSLLRFFKSKKVAEFDLPLSKEAAG